MSGVHNINYLSTSIPYHLSTFVGIYSNLCVYLLYHPSKFVSILIYLSFKYHIIYLHLYLFWSICLSQYHIIYLCVSLFGSICLIPSSIYILYIFWYIYIYINTLSSIYLYIYSDLSIFFNTISSICIFI